MPPGGRFVASRAGSFAFFLADYAYVLHRLADTLWILQLHRQFAGFPVTCSPCGKAAGLIFDHAEELVDLHHSCSIANLLKEPETLLVKTGSAIELVAVTREDALMLECDSL